MNHAAAGGSIDRGTRSGLALALIATAFAALFAGFVALGIWQVHRLAWKEALIARVTARTHAAPVAPPGPADWASIDEARAGYRRIVLHGRWLPGDTFVQAATVRGAGAWVMTPYRTDAGFAVLVNRGFVATGHGAIPPPAPGPVPGFLRLSEPKGGFLRHNDPPHDRWYSRDVAAIAAARHVADAAPYFIDADADATGQRPGAPIGGLTVIAFPNSHLGYAITWFALAAMTVAGYFIVMRDERRVRLKSDGPR